MRITSISSQWSEQPAEARGSLDLLDVRSRIEYAKSELLLPFYPRGPKVLSDGLLSDESPPDEALIELVPEQAQSGPKDN